MSKPLITGYAARISVSQIEPSLKGDAIILCEDRDELLKLLAALGKHQPAYLSAENHVMVSLVVADT